MTSSDLDKPTKNALLWIGRTGGVDGYGMSPNYSANERLVDLELVHENPSRPGQFRLTEKGRVAHRFLKTHQRDPGRHFRKPTRAQEAFISRKIRILRREGYSEKQAVAIAYRMAKVKRR